MIQQFKDSISITITYYRVFPDTYLEENLIKLKGYQFFKSFATTIYNTISYVIYDNNYGIYNNNYKLLDQN